MKTRWVFTAIALSLFCASPAWAHPASPGGWSGLAAGLAHPWLGLDHALVMIAIGLLAMRWGGRARWTLPAAFVGGMAAGLVLPIAAPANLFELGVAASVAGCGLMLWMGRRTQVAAFALAALFGILHGHVHATESLLASGALGGEFTAGVLLATTGLHGLGLIAGAAIELASRRRQVLLQRLIAAGLVAAGIGLIAVL